MPALGINPAPTQTEQHPEKLLENAPTPSVILVFLRKGNGKQSSTSAWTGEIPCRRNQAGQGFNAAHGAVLGALILSGLGDSRGPAGIEELGARGEQQEGSPRAHSLEIFFPPIAFMLKGSQPQGR